MPAGVVLVADHDHRIALLSILISILAAYAARALSERLTAASRRKWFAWLVGGSIVDGIGTWSMHYTGKLALVLPVPMVFDWPTVVLSLLIGIVGSGAALAIISRPTVGWARAFLASLCLGGIGIAGLHYTAMRALRIQATNHYVAGTVTLSVVFAVLCSMASLTLSFRRDNKPQRRWQFHGSAIMRGLANPLMHFTAMTAVIFTTTDQTPDRSHAVSIESLGIVGISIVPIMVLIVGLLTSFANRLQEQALLLQETNEQLRSLSARLQSAKEDEASRIAREIHDELGATLTSLRWDLEALDESLTTATPPQELRKQLAVMLRLMDTSITAVRKIAAQVRPRLLDELDITDAIREETKSFAAQTGIAANCQGTLEHAELTDEEAIAVLRIVQEALTNVRRHAGATNIRVTMNDGQNGFSLSIHDNGKGITLQDEGSTHTLGLLGMRERALLIGGVLTITGAQGTLINLEVPRQ